MTTAPAAADAARHLARTILAGGRFHQPAVPRPLHGALSAIGRLVRAPVNALENAVDAVGEVFPGGVTAVWILLAVLVVLATVRYARGRSRRELAGAPGPVPGARPRSESAAELIRSAEGAERDGRLADAVRLRFRAGLAALAERGSIPGARATATTEVARALGSPCFDALARRFDEIAYGGLPADAGDVETARRDWPSVLGQGDRR